MKSQPQIQNDLLNIKLKMEEIELTLESRIKDIASREVKFKEEDEQIEKLFSKKSNNIIRFNVSGKKFSTKFETLAKIKDHLLYKILSSQDLDFDEEIYFERSPLFFAEILNFLRIGRVNLKKFTTPQLEEFLEEAEYFEMSRLEELIKDELRDIEVINYQISSLYTYNNQVLGNPDLSVLAIPDSGCGFVANYPNAAITFELDREYEIDRIDIKGYNDPYNSSAWNNTYGSGAEIHVSRDGYTWTKTEGVIPYSFATSIAEIGIAKRVFKFIKFQHLSGYLGIGYLKLHKAK